MPSTADTEIEGNAAMAGVARSRRVELATGL